MKHALLILICCGFVACYSPAKPGGEASSTPETPTPSADVPIFPHPNGWSQPERHGGYLKQREFDTAQCTLCHGAALEGQSGPSCNECHAQYPHPTDWALPRNHGAVVKQTGTANCATQCHGAQLEGGLSGVSCNDCHTIWPHPAQGWTAGTGHGEKARSLGFDACTRCHTSSADALGAAGNCNNCHGESVLHHDDDDWAKTGHGAVVDADALLNDCTQCHGNTLQGGPQPANPLLKPAPGCQECHPSYPAQHQIVGWKDTYAGHGAWLMSQPTLNYESCQLCHGQDLAGGQTAPSCYGCHRSFPHPVPAKVAGGAYTPWLEKHGAYYLAKENASAATCATANCHGVDLQGNPPNVPVEQKRIKGCGDCHLKVPHPNGWESLHGAEASLGTEKCDNCHNVKSAQPNDAALAGAGQATSCYYCHQHYPIPHRDSVTQQKNTEWTTQGDHKTAVWAAAPSGASGAQAANLAGCTTCHSVNTAGDNSCYGCHESYPHAPPSSDQNIPWGEAQGHGAFVKTAPSLDEGIAACTMCHSVKEPAEAGNKAAACFSCHDPNDKYPHAAGWYAPGDPFGGGHGPNVVTATGPSEAGCLTGCHGLAGTGGISGSTSACTTCHAAYPHESSAWGWTPPLTNLPEHAQAVLETQGTPSKDDDTLSAAQFAACSACHGGVVTVKYGQKLPLTSGEQWTMKDGQPHLQRCYACHLYPHGPMQINDEQWEWGPGYAHVIMLLDWAKAQPLDKPGFVRKTCGGTINGEGGCHQDGPNTLVNSWAKSNPTCTTLCHVIQPPPPPPGPPEPEPEP